MSASSSTLTRIIETIQSDGDENSSTSLAEEDGVPNGVPNGALTASQFELFARETGFADDGVTAKGGTQTISGQGTRRMSIMGQHSSTHVSSRDVRQIFSASQNDAEDEAVLRKVDEVDNISHHHQLMSFSEWLESICVRIFSSVQLASLFIPHCSTSSEARRPEV